MKNLIIGITGASGSIYALRLMQVLLEEDVNLHLVITQAGRLVLNHELNWPLSEDKDHNESFLRRFLETSDLLLYDDKDLAAPIASGSFPVDGMVVVPASMGSISGIAHGRSSNLLERSADVILKERRRLIVVPRETPLNQIHLENLLSLSKLQVSVIPAMPAFYQQPKTIEDMVDFLVGRILDHLSIDHHLFKVWGQ